jgi:hypothetical protein
MFQRAAIIRCVWIYVLSVKHHLLKYAMNRTVWIHTGAAIAQAVYCLTTG